MNKFYIKTEQGDILTEKDIFSLIYRALCFLAQRLLHNKEEAEDKASEAFTEFLNRKNEFDEFGQIKEFLYKKVYDDCMLYLLKKKAAEKLRAEIEFLSSANQPNLQEEILLAELFRHLDLEIDKLSPQRRRTYDLNSIIPALTVEWMAEAMGVSKRTYYNTKNETIKALREALKKKGLISIILVTDLGIYLFSFNNHTSFILTS